MMIIMIISLIVGGAVFGFFGGWDYMGTYFGLQDIVFGGDDVKNYESVSATKFPKAVLDIWYVCKRRESPMSKTVLIEGEGTFGKKEFFGMISNASLCSSIQSVEFGCGTEEHFGNFTNVTLPSVVSIDCDGHSLVIKS